MNINKTILVFVSLLISINSCAQNKNDNNNNATMKFNELTPQEEAVILHKGTERPFTGKYINNEEEGTYVCKQCNAALYKTENQFDARCGWPSFDDEIEGAIKRVPDADGRRTEIICANCEGHLGHVFLDEGFTDKNTRHCVNSISMKFISHKPKLETAYFASGCFWGTEYYFMKANGVAATTVGYMGGHTQNPSYREVCTGTTGHLEITKVDFDSIQTSYEEMVKLFFETHDFTQTDGQGPDIGSQYLSAIFYSNEKEKEIAEKYIKLLEDKAYKVATMLKPVSNFWEAEDYHQEYYEKSGASPYCHSYTKIF